MDARVLIGMLIGIGIIALFLFMGEWDTFTDYFPTEGEGDILSCQENSDCVFVSNHTTRLECVSPNCPPPEEKQPIQGDSSYEWIVRHASGCVNTHAPNRFNDANEPFVIEERGGNCVCSPMRQCESAPGMG